MRPFSSWKARMLDRSDVRLSRVGCGVEKSVLGRPCSRGRWVHRQGKHVPRRRWKNRCRRNRRLQPGRFVLVCANDVDEGAWGARAGPYQLARRLLLGGSVPGRRGGRCWCNRRARHRGRGDRRAGADVRGRHEERRCQDEQERSGPERCCNGDAFINLCSVWGVRESRAPTLATSWLTACH